MNRRNLMQGLVAKSSAHNFDEYNNNQHEASKIDILHNLSLDTTHHNLSQFFNKDPSMEKLE